jgi:hypothetical protein
VNGLIRFALCGIVVGTFLTGLLAAYPEGAVALGVDFWNLPELQRRCEESQRHRAELDERTQPLMRRLQEKSRVSRELAAGRLTLLQAAVQFRDLNAQGRPNPVPLRARFAGSTEAERVCRQVILWTYEEVEMVDAERAERLRASLEEELRQELARHGSISWPEQQVH